MRQLKLPFLEQVIETEVYQPSVINLDSYRLKFVLSGGVAKNKIGSINVELMNSKNDYF